MLVLAPLIGLLPQAVLAAIVILCRAHQARRVCVRSQSPADEVSLGAGGLPRRAPVRHASGHHRCDRPFTGLASQSAKPKVYVIGRKRGVDMLRPVSPEHPDDETFEGLLILRHEGRLFFANVPQFSGSGFNDPQGRRSSPNCGCAVESGGARQCGASGVSVLLFGRSTRVGSGNPRACLCRAALAMAFP
jgi:hypothetical protein